MQLFFDNNLNHMKELDVLEASQKDLSVDRFVLYNDKLPINIKRSSNRAAPSEQQQQDSSFEITHRTNRDNYLESSTCPPQNLENVFNKQNKNQEDLSQYGKE